MLAKALIHRNRTPVTRLKAAQLDSSQVLSWSELEHIIYDLQLICWFGESATTKSCALWYSTNNERERENLNRSQNYCIEGLDFSKNPTIMPQILWVTFWVLWHVWSPIGRYRRTMKICQEFTGKHDKASQCEYASISEKWFTTLNHSGCFSTIQAEGPSINIWEIELTPLRYCNQITYIECDKILQLQAVWRLIARGILKSSLPPPRKINELLKSRQNAQWNSSFQFCCKKQDIKHPHTPSPLSFLSQATAITLRECSLCFLLWNRTTQLTSMCFLPDCTIHNKL